MGKLTAKQVENTTKPGRYFDQYGLFMRVEKNGSKRWLQRVTINGKRRELGLGSPDYVTLKEVRDQAYENKRLSKQGIDPIKERQWARLTPNFAEAANQVHDQRKPTWRNPKHADQFINTLRTYAFPAIGDRSVSDIDTADLMRILTPIWTSKHETARRVRQRIGVIMKWAIAQGYRKDNPADAISEALPNIKKRPKNRIALPYNEVANCILAVQNSEAGIVRHQNIWDD